MTMRLSQKNWRLIQNAQRSGSLPRYREPTQNLRLPKTTKTLKKALSISNESLQVRVAVTPLAPHPDQRINFQSKELPLLRVS